MLLLVVVVVLLLVVGFQLIRGLFFRGGMGMGGLGTSLVWRLVRWLGQRCRLGRSWHAWWLGT